MTSETAAQASAGPTGIALSDLPPEVADALAVHLTEVRWDKMPESPAYWTCSCGRVSPLMPPSAATGAALGHQSETLAARQRVVDALAAHGIEVRYGGPPAEGEENANG